VRVKAGRFLLIGKAWCVVMVLASCGLMALEAGAQQSDASAQPSAQPSEQQQPPAQQPPKDALCKSGNSTALGQQVLSHAIATASLQGVTCDTQGRILPGVKIELLRAGVPVNAECHSSGNEGRKGECYSNGEGIFRVPRVPSGTYDIRAEKEGYSPQTLSGAQLRSGDLITLQVRLEPTNAPAPDKVTTGLPGASGTGSATPSISAYPTAIQNLNTPAPEGVAAPPIVVASAPSPNRWNLSDMPLWQRYGNSGDYPYVVGHWYDPFNRNILKGDRPVIGQNWFFNFTGTSLSSINVRRLPIPSGVPSENPGSEGFFGKGQQGFASQSFILSFDLFQGDTSFRPIDWQFRFTPVINLNFLQTRERGLVNVDPREGILRFDTHTGIQEAFVEAKIHDLSPNYDFFSVRAGIQQFVSDFRGFIFADEEPGIRIFGNLKSNRISYNLAYFYFLEKNTNSGLNTLTQRHQQVYVANTFIQDFFAKGYTTEFSFHYNRDDPTIHFDDNGFLVRPAPIGDVVNGKIITHQIEAYYLGWTGNGHIGRINVSNAFYQALGHDTFNPIAGRPVNINAQMGALELSIDKDWARYYTSVFYASGDSSYRYGPTRSSTAHGFDTIVDDTNFAGGAFSFWDQQQIGLLSTGVTLTTPASLLPALRSNKEEGQANFVNPGIYIFTAGADFNLTTNLRGFSNFNYLRFDRTEPLEILLFQNNPTGIKHSIGEDVGFGVRYRPKLNENWVVTAGEATLFPGAGLDNLYNSKVLLSGFASLALTF